MRAELFIDNSIKPGKSEHEKRDCLKVQWFVIKKTI